LTLSLLSYYYRIHKQYLDQCYKYIETIKIDIFYAPNLSKFEPSTEDGSTVDSVVAVVTNVGLGIGDGG
jgi:hypothetical protein